MRHLLPLIAAVAVMLSTAPPASASHPYPYQPEPVGNRSVAVNWAYCRSSTACWQIDVLDWTGDARMTLAKGTAYYVGAWNGNFDDKMHVLADVYPLTTGSPVGYWPEPGSVQLERSMDLPDALALLHQQHELRLQPHRARGDKWSGLD